MSDECSERKSGQVRWSEVKDKKERREMRLLLIYIVGNTETLLED